MTQVKLTTKNCKTLQFKTSKITNPNLASVILNLMSRDDLGKKQTIILNNCIINDERYEFVVTPHRQTIEYIRTRRQTQKNISNQKQIVRK